MTREEFILSKVKYDKSMPMHSGSDLTCHHFNVGARIRYVLVTHRKSDLVTGFRAGPCPGYLPRKFVKALLLAAFPFI